MPKKYPPLTPQEVISILKARGFTYIRTSGSHEHYEGTIKNRKTKSSVSEANIRRIVTVDGHYDNFSEKLIKYMIAQSGLTREEFYGSTKQTAKKINLSSKVFTSFTDAFGLRFASLTNAFGLWHPIPLKGG